VQISNNQIPSITVYITMSHSRAKRCTNPSSVREDGTFRQGQRAAPEDADHETLRSFFVGGPEPAFEDLVSELKRSVNGTMDQKMKKFQPIHENLLKLADVMKRTHPTIAASFRRAIPTEDQVSKKKKMSTSAFSTMVMPPPQSEEKNQAEENEERAKVEEQVEVTGRVAGKVPP
jgi:hypothetical protein